MLAGKAVPKQCVDYLSGKVKTRRSIGVRMPADPICQVPRRHRMHPVSGCCTLLHVTRSSDTDTCSAGHGMWCRPYAAAFLHDVSQP